MFDQQDDQNGNQAVSNDQGAPTTAAQSTPANDAQASPAAPPPDHQFAAPQQAYESLFDDDENSTHSAGLPVPGNPPPQQVVADDQAVASPVNPADDADLLNIKKQALEHLSPLVGQLEQTNEERFHTIMRIIQASDNHTLVKDAFAAAQQIEDDKVRAQALLDIINEINYFTKENGEETPAATPET